MARWRQWLKQFWKLRTRWTSRTREPWDITVLCVFHSTYSYFLNDFVFFFETIYLSILYHMHNLYYNCNLLGIRRTFCSRKEKAKSNVNTTNVNIKYTCFLYFFSWRKENTVITKKRNLKLSSILFTLLFFSPRNYILLTPIFRFEQ